MLDEGSEGSINSESSEKPADTTHELEEDTTVLNLRPKEGHERKIYRNETNPNLRVKIVTEDWPKKK